MSEQPLLEIAEALAIRPGDTLLLRMPSNVTEAQLARCRDHLAPSLKERLPQVEVIVLGGVEQMAVYRPDRPVEGDSA
ncbi:hypothetical protein [Streptosporangium saharense]|uniref:hypothetical protein n=1 Tax=Streptosporangium saharense TaxID=1706840 RepID=UPI00341F1D92